MVRNIFAGFLGIVAVLIGFLGVAAHWVHALAHDPEPTEKVAVAIAKDPSVQSAIAAELVQRIESALPEVDLPYPELKDNVTTLLRQGIEQVLANQSADELWRTVLGNTRSRLVADLKAWRSGDPTPNLTLDLTPVAQTIIEQLRASSDPATALLAQQITVPDSIVVTGAQLPVEVTEAASPTLELSHLWLWVLLLAAAFVVVALLFANRRGRGGILFLIGLLAVIGALGLRAAATMLPSLARSSQPGLSTTVVSATGRELSGSLADAGQWLLWGGIAATVIGLVWWVTASRRVSATGSGRGPSPVLR